MAARDDTFGHTPLSQMMAGEDVYGIAQDAQRADRRPVHIAIIGAGGIVQSKYLPAITRLRTLWEPVQVVAVADPNETQGRKVEQIYGARWYADHWQMLEREVIDGVLVASPDGLHAEHASDAVGHGLPTLVEKPFTTSLTRGAALWRQAERERIPLLAVANLRFSPAHRRARQLITAGTIPDPGLLVAKMNIGYPYVDLLEDVTVHLFDLARFYMGDVESVAADADRHTPGNRGYPFAHGGISVRFQSGAVGMLSTTSRALSLKPWQSVEVYGDRAWLSIDDLYELTLYDDEQGPTKSWRPVLTNTLLFDEEFGGYTGLMQHFIDVIRGDAAPLVTGGDGYRACELVAASHLAIASGARITLPLEPERADHEVAGIRRRAAGAPPSGGARQ